MLKREGIGKMRLKDLGFIKDVNRETNLVIYGASGGGIKVASALKSFDVEIDYFVDGDENKWGKTILGKMVYQPEYVINDDCRIIIASDAYYSEIKKYLFKIGKKDSLLLREDIIFPLVKEWAKDFNIEVSKKLSEKSVFIELLEGYQLGGIEQWSLMLAKGLKESGINTEILAKKVENIPREWKLVLNTNFSGEYIDFKKCIQELVAYIVNHLPCTLILNKQQQLFYAGYIVNILYPGKVKIVSVIHSDIEMNFVRQKFFDNYIDKYMCVSKKIMKQLEINYNIEQNKLFYKENPVDIEDNNIIDRKYTVNRNEPIKIGYAARLEKSQKRSDLLLELILYLEKNRVNYNLEIAGIGSYYSIIEQFIKNNGLDNKIQLLGVLDHREIGEFWKNKDIAVNLSESEGGISISILEAMYCGALPIIFNISSSTDIINDKITGFIINFGDCYNMARKIKELEKKRDQIKAIGVRASTYVKNNCMLRDYLDYIKKII